MSKSVKFSPTSIAKVFLHATKFPHCSINGVLLSSARSDSESSPVVVTDAIPFFHDHLSLTPMLEVALCQVERYCQANKLEIAGYYQIGETADATALDFVAQRIGDRINDHFPGAFLMTVDFKSFFSAASSANNPNPAVSFCVQVPRDGKWRPLERDAVGIVDVDSADFSAGLKKLVFDDVHNELCDFDDHLDNVALDWRNPKITELVSSVF